MTPDTIEAGVILILILALGLYMLRKHIKHRNMTVKRTIAEKRIIDEIAKIR